MKNFCENYSTLEVGEILDDLNSWLATLFGGDDKTFVFLLQEGLKLEIDLDFCVDESKNKFRLGKEIARGGQGAVFQTQFPNVVLKL